MGKHGSNGTYTLKRREFVQRSMVAAAMLAAGRGFALSFPKRGAQVKRYSALEELPPVAVQPQGWLGAYLDKQRKELGSQLPAVSWPFTEAYWSGLEQGDSW